MSRPDRRNRFSELAARAFAHKEVYTAALGPFTISIHPGVFSPKYFTGPRFYGESLPAIVQQCSFLEIGVGTGLVSLFVAAAQKNRSQSSTAAGPGVVGVDIDPVAVDITRQNFAANGQAGEFLVSDLFGALEGRRFDHIFWNHPWAWDTSQPEDERDPMFFDECYGMLRRCLAQAKGHLSGGGSLLLGTSDYANLALMEEMYSEYGFSHKIVGMDEQEIGRGLSEVLLLIELKSV